MSRRFILSTAACVLLSIEGRAVPQEPATGRPERIAVAQELLDRQWPAHWIAAPDAPARDGGVYHFRRTVTLDAAPQRFVVHVSADNRYLLHVNGRRVGTGPARGDLENWPFDTYDLAPFLQPGSNLVAATVWNFGVDAPMAQMSRRTGFMLQGDDAAARVLDTNREWLAQVERGHAPNPASISAIRARRFYYAAAPGERRDGALYDWRWDRPDSDPGRWRPAREIWRAHPRSIREGPGWMMSPEGWLLVPNSLPAMRYEPISPGDLVRQTGATIDTGFPSRGQARIPPQTEARILLDRRELTNGYPEIVVSGGRGARVRVTYAEALYDAAGAKGNRNEIEGKEILGIFDELIADGERGRRFEPLWFRTWRFLEIAVTTTDQPLTIDSLGAHFTGYPFVKRAHFASNDESLTRIFDTGWLTARLAAHETYMDAPYWEQLQYLGDTRIDALITLAMTGDDRLPRRALELFDQSRSPEGLTQSRYPTAEPQYIPPYSLFFVDMLHDHWMYVGDRAFLTARLPATRSVLDWFLARRRADGLLDRLPYWVHGDTGTALDDVVQDADGGSGIVSIQLLGALRRAAELEEVAGDRARATSYRAAADSLAKACAVLWDREHGLMADTPRRRSWSHPVNIVALLENVVPPAAREQVTRHVLAIARHPAGRSASGGRGAAWPIAEIPSASYYFRFYLARALESAGTTAVADAYVDLLGPWRTMLGNGLTTWAEHPEPTRSDCHAWSAHPTLDLLRVVAGIRPGSGGFSTVILSPALGPLTRVSASHPHPRGDIVVSYERAGTGTLSATVSLPAGVKGELRWGGQRRPLAPGQQRIQLTRSNRVPSR